MAGFEWETNDGERIIGAGCVTDVRMEGDRAIIGFEKGEARVESFDEGIIRITLTADSFLNLNSIAVVGKPDKRLELAEDNGCISIKNGRLSIVVNKGSSRLSVINHSGIRMLDLDQAFLKSKNDISIKAGISEHEMFMGLGEKTGFLDKRGRRYVMWNTDEYLHTPDKDPLYKSIPFLIGMDDEKTYGLFVDSIARSEFDLGFEDRDRMAISVYDSELDMYLIDGESVSDVVSRYTSLTGRMEMPPIWSLGFQQCRWSYFPQERVLEVAKTFREKKIPCDAIYLDIDYMDGFRLFTWDTSRFPDPDGMIRQLSDMGFKLVTIIDPGVKKDSNYNVYLEGAKNHLFCEYPTGEAYHGRAWPGIAAFPDFSKAETRKWWGEKHAGLFSPGVGGIWNDMNEPSDFSPEDEDRTKKTVPADVMMDFDGSPRPFGKCHNSYGFLMCRGTYEGFKALKPEERPFIVTRSAYAGIQRYSAVWTGDNHSWWEHLASSIPMHMNIGLSGVPFVGGDVGGFQGECSPELYARWIQLGAFTPFFRAHSAIHTKAHEPWAFGPEVEEIARKAVNLRYSLIPYLYSEFKNACDTGLPIMRPLVLDFQDDAEARRIDDQFMFGRSIMVAPVIRPNTRKRMVYLPRGNWYDFHTKARLEGGRFIIADAPLDRIPLFVREGSIIPFAGSEDSTRFMNFNALRIEVYRGPQGSFTLYEDDGITQDCKEGVFNIRRFSQSSTSAHDLTFRIENQTSGYDNGLKKAHVEAYGLDEYLKSSDCAFSDGAYRFETDGSDREIVIR